LLKNVIDEYKSWETIKIKEDLDRKAFNYSVLMQHISGDFNISTFVRNANAFGVKNLFYFGKRKWDRRGAVGTHNYKQLVHIENFEDLKNLKNSHRFIAIENSVENPVELSNFIPQENDLYIFGEEMLGIKEEILELCEEFVYIKQFGSVRSLNVGTASGIIMNHVSSFLSNKVS